MQPSPSSGPLLAVRQPSQSRRTMRLDLRRAALWTLCVFLAGTSTGSFFCGVVVTSFESDKVVEPPLPVRTRKRRLRPDELKSPTPVIVMGLMKAGTTSIYGYFSCGLVEGTPISHYDCKPGVDPSKIGMACGKRMRRNLTKYHKPAFDSMDHFVLYAELDAQELNGGMALPQWDYLEQIYQHFPQATWILNWREPQKWLDSVDRWKDLRQRFVDNPFLPDSPKGTGAQDAEMLHFYKRQAERVREFAQTHPSLSLVELPMDSPEAGSILEQAFGISSTCWKNRNINTGDAIWTGN